MDEPPRVARASIAIAASPEAVWQTLTAPETIPRIMPVREVLAPWQPGREFAWVVEMVGGDQRMEGRVLRFIPPRVLEYEFVDPHARAFRGVERVHRVTIELAREGEGTRVEVAQDNHDARAAWAHAEGGWRLALGNLRAIVEGTREGR